MKKNQVQGENYRQENQDWWCSAEVYSFRLSFSRIVAYLKKTKEASATPKPIPLFN